MDEGAVSRCHVGRRVECSRAGEQVWEARHQQQRLLSTHAAAERIHAVPIDVEPAQRVLGDLRHAGEVANLPRVTPGVEGQVASLTLGIDDGEAADRRQPAPAPNVLLRAHPAPMGRDDERDRRMEDRAVPRRKNQKGVPHPSVMGAVGDRDHSHLRRGDRRTRGDCHAEDGDERRRQRRKDLGRAHRAQNVGRTASHFSPRNERLTERQRC